MLACKLNLPPPWKLTFWYSFYLQNNCSAFLYFLSFFFPPCLKRPGSFCGIGRLTLHWVCSEGKNTVCAEWIFSHSLCFLKWKLSAAPSNQQREFSHLNNFLTSETQTCHIFSNVMLPSRNCYWKQKVKFYSQDCLTLSSRGCMLPLNFHGYYWARSCCHEKCNRVLKARKIDSAGMFGSKPGKCTIIAVHVLLKCAWNCNLVTADTWFLFEKKVSSFIFFALWGEVLKVPGLGFFIWKKWSNFKITTVAKSSSEMFTVALLGKKASPEVINCIILILYYKPTYQVLYNDLSCKIKWPPLLTSIVNIFLICEHVTTLPLSKANNKFRYSIKLNHKAFNFIFHFWNLCWTNSTLGENNHHYFGEPNWTWKYSEANMHFCNSIESEYWCSTFCLNWKKLLNKKQDPVFPVYQSM